MCQMNSYLSSVGVDGIFCRVRKKPVVWEILNLKLNTRLPTKRYENLTLMLSERNEKHLSPKFT